MKAIHTEIKTGAENLSAVRSSRYCRLLALWKRIDLAKRSMSADRSFDDRRRVLVSRQGRIVDALCEEGAIHE